jgi:hypothetical protein
LIALAAEFTLDDVARAYLTAEGGAIGANIGSALEVEGTATVLK